MKPIITVILVFTAVCSVTAQNQADGSRPGQASLPQEQGALEKAVGGVSQQLEASLRELAELRKQIAAEKLPLNRELSELEGQLSDVRAELQEKSRKLDSHTLTLTNLDTDNKFLKKEAEYVTELLGDYLREFDSRIHIAERQKYLKDLEEARLAPDQEDLPEAKVFDLQIGMISATLERLHDLAGGGTLTGRALDADGLFKEGKFVLIGPVALFRSDDGEVVGITRQHAGSYEPSIVPFGKPEDQKAAGTLVETLSGDFPLDPTLGNAHKVESTEETLIEHVKKGGPVMIPIFAMAGLALLIALYKWLGLSFIKRPSRRRLSELLAAVESGDPVAAQTAAAQIKGPIGKMLGAGVDHLGEPKELVEEVMYETVLTTRLKLQRLLPFIAICAASAPLLGLLGTVTGIINTFKMIEIYGSGDVKNLSGGISEALITTKFGLIVAIPSLLLHAFLSRKVRGIIGRMETSAVAFVNAVARTPKRGMHLALGGDGSDTDVVRRHVQTIIKEMLGPVVEGSGGHTRTQSTVNGIEDAPVFDPSGLSVASQPEPREARA